MPRVSLGFSQLYENFVEEVDAVDNGISQYDGEPRYAVSTTLSSRVAHLNPAWNSKSQDTEVSARWIAPVISNCGSCHILNKVNLAASDFYQFAELFNLTNPLQFSLSKHKNREVIFSFTPRLMSLLNWLLLRIILNLNTHD